MGRFIAALVLLASLVPAQAHKELGKMWTFENVPLEFLKEAYGFSPSQPWLDHARLSSLRFGGGCSASFVSPRGLILTNHHCGRSYVARVTPEDQDWLANGFFAKSLAQEVKVPGLTVQQLVSMKDVTAEVISGDVRSNRERVIAEAKKAHPDLKPEVVSLYQGGMFQLYLYRVFEDVRLVASPHLQSAKFGGDPDNFTFPRFSLDYALFRAWDEKAPVDTKDHYLRYRTEGPSEGDAVFVVGNPGRTGRLNTVAQMEAMRDAEYPMILDNIRGRIAGLEAQLTPETEKELTPQILRQENGRKAYQGFLDGLRNEAVMDVKRAAEKAIRDKVAADPDLARYGEAWEKLARLSAEKARLLNENRYYHDYDSPILLAGYHLARATSENASRRAKTQARRELRKLDFGKGDAKQFVAELTKACEALGRDDPFVESLVGDRSPAEAVASLAERSVLDDAATIQELLEADAAKVRAMDDVALRIGRAIVKARSANRGRLLELRSEEPALATEIGKAFFAVYGTSIPPDATFTLRLSDGVVKGFPCNGTLAPWFTTLYGFYARHTEFGGKKPFNIPAVWDKARRRLDLKTPFNLVCTCDIIGGNSGSPLIDAQGRLVGLVFDGNIESLANRFVFTDEVARTVCVHPRIIITSLRDIYGSGRLADEMEGKGRGYK